MTDQYKAALRTTLKQVRANTSAQFRAKASLQVCNRIRALEPYRKAKHVALYFAINGEVDLTPIWKTAPLHGKFCYFPIVNEDFTLTFLPATPATSFKTNRFGILEPEVSIEHAKSPEELDLIIMPMVGFDIHCLRIGMGSGCYDRTLANKNNGILFGVAYQFQRLDFINAKPWDIPLNAVITEKAIYWRYPAK
ncbi:5-formyltetrahydrofolate cyclo-ligase [Legionella sp. km772]|uniref:5-formyltetrahydrofolate cyclo-ligase n=1 Tax=Legionella sp. km772 TaxID=2498111 RepID=UPI000F8EC387|nr:5-formyltetrahydrofolate cyclo-ligase [Legionella sp. km772]RUR12426.1 5-formyltetrahydrofolate cyclo-ligase [Legionella sp. km772]